MSETPRVGPPRDPLERLDERLARVRYRLGQRARVGLYSLQSVISDRYTKPIEPPRPLEGPVPGRKAILADLERLMAEDLENVRQGLYRMPHDLVGGPLNALLKAPAFFRDLPRVERRRQSREKGEVLEAHREKSDRFPRYFLQNFHYQTDGYLSEDSARLYDHQVEVLFGGGADAMRRRALVPVARFMEGRRVAETRLADLGCGTGRFLSFVKDNWPRMAVTALDLSPPYLEAARNLLRPWRCVDFVEGPAEATGLGDESQDIVTSLFLFHELPRKVRGQVVAEVARVLKPGGLFVLLDSLQEGDRPEYRRLLQYFPVAFHEPYYVDYTRHDLGPLFKRHGLRLETTDVAYFCKVFAVRKPERG